MSRHSISVHAGDRASFRNNAPFCVGTGRMGLALHREYLDQLALAQELAGFSHIRGHGLFCDDMAIYQPYTDENGVRHENYNFTYLDRVVDSYLALHIKPFLELGFMPEKMASGTQTIFYWKGNTTPPADHDKWARMVKATLRHLALRYGEDEVSSWPCEVWNEPNLAGFWENADKAAYLHLYEVTAPAVKEALPRMQVGGPAICGGEGSQEWVKDFLTLCREKQLPVDFVSRHCYLGETTRKHGRYTYHTMRSVEDVYEEMMTTRALIDSFPEYKGMPMHITEFNTSYNPICPIHDTNLNAAYIAGILSCFGDAADSYSYWTFGDVFEEQGVPARPFHGGFGMIADQLIPKPTMWTFAFFNNLKGECVHRDESSVILRREDGSYEGVVWNLCRKKREAAEVEITLPAGGETALVTRTVDEVCCNPLKIWHDLGEPASLTRDQLTLLRQSAQPLCASQVIPACSEAKFSLTLNENAVVHFTLTPRQMETEYGYDYQWYLEHA
ncbi:MAG: xylan 1,4-beta-xylosidase [Clostridia bacterium]|nr:xylan 1,4-beta-xylosidase [Clostridia bacterium]